MNDRGDELRHKWGNSAAPARLGPGYWNPAGAPLPGVRNGGQTVHGGALDCPETSGRPRHGAL